MLGNECDFLSRLGSVFTFGVIRRNTIAAAPVAGVVADGGSDPSRPLCSRWNLRGAVVLDFVGPTVGLADVGRAS